MAKWRKEGSFNCPGNYQALGLINLWPSGARKEASTAHEIRDVNMKEAYGFVDKIETKA